MRNRIKLFFLFAALFTFAYVNAQTQSPILKQQTQKVEPANEEDIVRITTNLIQIDAVVTKNGKQVTNLRPEDFEILENGKPQKITNFSYVTFEPTQKNPVAAENKDANKQTTLSVSQPALRFEQVKRTLVLMVDDCGMSNSNIVQTREALKKFVDEQMQQGDLVALVRTREGAGVLQQFTTNKKQLYKAIGRIRYITSKMCSSRDTFDSINEAQQNLENDLKQSGGQNKDKIGEKDIAKELSIDREKLFNNNLLGTLEYVVGGMSELPGRKAVILFSEGFDPTPLDGGANNIEAKLKILTERANRAGVVIYTLDPTGASPAGITAEDSVTNPRIVQSILSARRRQILNTEQGLRLISEPTGGFLIRNTNNIGSGVQKVLDDQSGYYLIGYQPDPDTFDPLKSKYNNLAIKLKKSGMEIRYRSGFFGIKDKDEEKKPQVALTPHEQVLKALLSPFASEGVNLSLTAIFTNEENIGSYIRSLIHISAGDLTFTKTEDGRYTTKVDVVAMTLGNIGEATNQTGKVYELSVPANEYEATLKNGFVYSLNMPVSKAGSYQLRIAVRDEGSGIIGTVNQYVEVPDLDKGELEMSGLILTGDDSQTQHFGGYETDPLVQAVQRRFRAGQVLQYGFIIYNARLDKNTNLPNLTTQMRFYKGEKEIFTGKEVPLNSSRQTDLKRLQTGGAVNLSSLSPGEYVLQITVKDSSDKEKSKTVLRQIEFEVLKSIVWSKLSCDSPIVS